MMPVAMTTALASVSERGEGSSPQPTSDHDGSAMISIATKHSSTMVIMLMTKASSRRKPRCCRTSTSSTSSTVSATPASSGMLNSRLRAMAVPMTSARSVAQIASSARIHCDQADQREAPCRHACARSMPVTSPSRLASTWSSIAMRLDIATTQSRE
ncbi:hypothetical protein D3C85_1336870 [compost metagenome]